jgi:hypothetical protein
VYVTERGAMMVRSAICPASSVTRSGIRRALMTTKSSMTVPTAIAAWAYAGVRSPSVPFLLERFLLVPLRLLRIPILAGPSGAFALFCGIVGQHDPLHEVVADDIVLRQAGNAHSCDAVEDAQ